MKYLYGLVMLFLSVSILNAQPIRSSSIIQGTTDITVINSTASTNSSTIVLGFFSGTITSESAIELTSYGVGRDYFVAKFDQDGVVVWMKQIGSPGNDYVGGGIGSSTDGSVFVTGGFKNYVKASPTDSIQSTGAFDSFFVKYDENGNLVWLKSLGTSAKNARTNSLVLDNTDKVMVSGFFTDSVVFDAGLTLYSDDGVDDYFYGQFDPTTGDRIWVKKIIGIDNISSGRIFDVANTADSYIFAGLYADSVGFESDTIVSTNNTFDVHIIKTDLLGDVSWIRSIKGNDDEYTYSVTTDPTGDIYVAGYHNSNILNFDSTDVETVLGPAHQGSDDIFIAKYSSAGTLQWVRTAGGIGTDKVYGIDYFDNAIHMAGSFSNSFHWGGLEMITEAAEIDEFDVLDQDMFYGSIDLDGNFRSAQNYHGRNSSTEEGRAIFNSPDGLSIVIRSNSDLMILDEPYTNPSENFFVAVAIIGCDPINLSLISSTDVECFSDSTGLLLLNATGGSGAYMYSIDNGLSYHDSPLFDTLTAGSYPTAVHDINNCTGTGPIVEITEPDEIIITSTDSTAVTCIGLSTGTITLDVSGGETPYSYSTDGGTTFNSSIPGLPKGDYYLAIEDDNGCILLGDTVGISEPEALTFTGTAYNLNCNSADDGSFVIEAAGGVPTYMFSTDGGTVYVAEDSISGLAAGTYTLAVKDANDCVTVGDAVELIEPDPLTISIESETGIIGDNDGEIVVDASGGTSPYKYTLQPTGTEQDNGTFAISEVNTYTVEVLDSLNCGPVSTGDIVITGFADMRIKEANIYPNPSNGLVTVEYSTEKSEMDVEVYSISGHRVMTKQVFSNGGEVSETFDMSSLAKGTYLIRVDGETLSSGVILK